MHRSGGPFATRLHGHVNVVAECRESLRDGLHVHRSPEHARNSLIERHIQHAPEPRTTHAPVFLRSAKNGPERTRPNSNTSTFINVESVIRLQ